jgi:hypothetical protein
LAIVDARALWSFDGRIEIEVPMHVEAAEAELEQIYGRQAWLVAADVLQAAGATIRRLRAWGAPRCFAIAARNGTGEAPSAEDCEFVVLDLPPQPMMDAIHAAEDAVRTLSPAIQAAVDRFDPSGQLRVIGPIFSDGRPVAGRRFWGARPAAWRALEDKVVIDALWDAAGVPRAPSQVAPVDLEALRAAADRQDEGHGTVWAGDASRGFHGGATYTCRVTTPAEALIAYEHLRTRCRAARVMPYLRGIPCSIHGVVFPTHTLVLRPAEMLTLLRPGGTGFLYARAATFWDPPADERAALRDLARRVGDHLRRTVGYRGAFTVDGVMTGRGFRPTELNPRVGAALGLMVPSFGFSFLHDALVEGLPLVGDPVGLEEELLAQADAHRNGSIGFVVNTPFSTTVRRSLLFQRGEWRASLEGEPVDGELSVGPGPSGGFVNLTLTAARTPTGPPVAPRAAALVRYVDAHFATGIGEVSPAI